MVSKRLRVLINKFPMLFWCFIVMLIVLGCHSYDFIREAGFTPGEYQGTGQGRQGLIRVRLQISQAGIEDIIIVSHRESAYPGAAAMEDLLEEILETGSTDLDAVSGATISSTGFLEAVEDALFKASAKR